MRWIRLSRHNGQLHLEKVRARFRRKLLAAIRQAECIVVDADEAQISPADLDVLVAGLPEERVKVIRAGVRPAK
jgi:hypothetical protein